MRTLTLLLLVLGLVGCETAPESLVELEDAGVEMMRNAAHNFEAGKEALVEWGLIGHTQVIDLLAELSVRDASDDLVVVTGEGEEGEVLTDTIESIDPGTAIQILRDYKAKIEELRQAVATYDERWDEAKSEFTEALEMRRQVREWLTRTGVRPEHIDAVTRALEGELSRR